MSLFKKKSHKQHRKFLGICQNLDTKTSRNQKRQIHNTLKGKRVEMESQKQNIYKGASEVKADFSSVF